MQRLATKESTANIIYPSIYLSIYPSLSCLLTIKIT